MDLNLNGHLRQGCENIQAWTTNQQQSPPQHTPSVCPWARLSLTSFCPPPPFTPLFLIPPPSFHPIFCPPCGSSIYQPPWFSLYLPLRGSAAHIKYLEADGLVQQPGNLSTERERKRGRERQHEASLPWISRERSLRKSPKGRRAPFSRWVSLSMCQGVITGWAVWSECENTVEADLVSAEEDRGGHMEQKKNRRRRRYVVSLWEEIFKLG